MNDKSQQSVQSASSSDLALEMQKIIIERRKEWYSWRTEPEISLQRQRYLTALLETAPRDDPDFYPFYYEKLTRADVEWLVVNLALDEEKVLLQMKEVLENEGFFTGTGIHDVSVLRKKMQNVVSHAQSIDLRGTILAGVDLTGIPLNNVLFTHADLSGANLKRCILNGLHLERAMLDGALLQRASLEKAHLEGATLAGVHLEEASLRGTHLQGAEFRDTHLEGALLSDAHFDSMTKFQRVVLSNKTHGSIILNNVDWNGMNLAETDWSQLKQLGDEVTADNATERGKHIAKEHPHHDKKILRQYTSLGVAPYKRAARENHRLAQVLQGQGLIEDARRFAYRSCILQRKALRLQKNVPSYIGSLFLDCLSGYGYHPSKSFLVYLFVISIFMLIYHLAAPALSFMELFVISMSAFHGRGFFPGTFTPSDPAALVGAVEAFVGLIIEVTFIATLTQRLFSK